MFSYTQKKDKYIVEGCVNQPDRRNPFTIYMYSNHQDVHLKYITILSIITEIEWKILNDTSLMKQTIKNASSYTSLLI